MPQVPKGKEFIFGSNTMGSSPYLHRTTPRTIFGGEGGRDAETDDNPLHALPHTDTLRRAEREATPSWAHPLGLSPVPFAEDLHPPVQPSLGVQQQQGQNRTTHGHRQERQGDSGLCHFRIPHPSNPWAEQWEIQNWSSKQTLHGI